MPNFFIASSTELCHCDHGKNLFGGLRVSILVPHIHWRRIWVQVKVLQVSEIKHGHVQDLCML